MSSIPSIFSGNFPDDGVLTVILPDGPLNVNSDHPFFKDILVAVESDDADEIRRAYKEGLASIEKPEASLAELSEGRAEYRNGCVYFDGKEVHSVIATRIKQFAEYGLTGKVDALLRFLERVDKNPSYQSQQELYDFLENKGLPITEDGYFLAYKAVSSNWRDKYSGRIDNSIGKTVEMARGRVNDNRSHHCSAGLHAGALDYVAWYGGGDDRIIVVKIDPADVVSVPSDHSCQKLRTCKYFVLKEFSREMLEPVYDAQGNSYCPERNECEDDYEFDGWDDDHEEVEDDYYDPDDVESY